MILVSSVLNAGNERTQRDCRRPKPNKKDKPCRTQTHHSVNHTSWKIKHLCSYIYFAFPTSTFIATRRLLSTALCPLPLKDSQGLGALHAWAAGPRQQQHTGGLGRTTEPPRLGAPCRAAGAVRLSRWSRMYKCGTEALPLQPLPLNSSLNMSTEKLYQTHSGKDKLTSESGV